MNRPIALERDSIRLLEQAVDLIEQLDDELFVATGPGFESGSVGAQLRHCLDSYRCLFGGLEAGFVDYDARERDVRVETERPVAIARIRSTCSALNDLSPRDGGRALSVVCEGGGPAGTSSTVARELQFLMSHVVHHYALIAMILRTLDVVPPADFGIAPSTLKHWDANAQRAR